MWSTKPCYVCSGSVRTRHCCRHSGVACLIYSRVSVRYLSRCRPPTPPPPAFSLTCVVSVRASSSPIVWDSAAQRFRSPPRKAGEFFRTFQNGECKCKSNIALDQLSTNRMTRQSRLKLFLTNTENPYKCSGVQQYLNYFLQGDHSGRAPGFGWFRVTPFASTE